MNKPLSVAHAPPPAEKSSRLRKENDLSNYVSGMRTSGREILSQWPEVPKRDVNSRSRALFLDRKNILMIVFRCFCGYIVINNILFFTADKNYHRAPKK